MNKQEAIEEIYTASWDDFNYKGLIVDVETVNKIIYQIDEPQKVTVPEFVGEWIEYCKHEKFYALHGAYARMNDRLCRWRFSDGNSELFAKAWLAYPNIVVEKEN